MSSPFGRVITAMVTPFKPDLSLDLDSTAELASKLADSGSDAIVVAGSTGEAATLTADEKISLFTEVVQAVKGRAKVLAGTGTYSTAESVKLTKRAETTGVDGFLIVAPYYNKPPQDGLYRHFAAVAESSKLPFMLYNIPSRTMVNILPDTTLKLAEIDNIVAIKESSGSLDQMSEIVRRAGDKIALYSGDDPLALPVLSIGGVGVVSVASHLVGPQLQEMVKAYLSGDVKRAAEIHLSLTPLFKGLFTTTNPILIKAALNLTGIKVGGLRPPLVDATEREINTLNELLKNMAIL